MLSRFLSLVAVFALTAFASASSAAAFEPKPGHYSGTDNHGGHISFRLTHHGDVAGLHIRGDHLGDYDLSVTHHHFRWNILFGKYPNSSSYEGHGRWQGAMHCAGDFRYYKKLGTANDYYTWSAHWTH